MALIACTECGKEISDKAAACPGCGAPVTATKPAVAQRMEAMDGFCPACGDDCSMNAMSCLQCGAMFDSSSGQRPVAKRAEAEPSSAPMAPRQMLVKSAKSRGVYIILGLFFGLLGIHNFYAGRLGIGVAQLLVTCILGWFVVGIVITAIWVLIEMFTVTHDGAGDAFA